MMVIINFICDILLFINFNGANVDLSWSLLKETPIYLINIGSLVGVVVLSTLVIPVFGWIKQKTLSLWIILPYIVFVLGSVLFHGLFFFIGEATHNNNKNKFETLQSVIDTLGLLVFLTGSILTITLAINKYKKKVYFSWWVISLLPLFTMIFFGILLNKVIYLPAPVGGYYAILSGTIPIFLLVLALKQISVKYKQ